MKKKAQLKFGRFIRSGTEIKQSDIGFIRSTGTHRTKWMKKIQLIMGINYALYLLEPPTDFLMTFFLGFTLFIRQFRPLS